MKDYKVYFEIGGKKLKTTVCANNEHDAKTKVWTKIKFIKVEEVDVPDFTDTLADFLGFKR